MKAILKTAIGVAALLVVSGSAVAAPPALGSLPLIGSLQSTYAGLPPTLAGAIGGVPVVGPLLGGNGNLASIPLLGSVVGSGTLLGLPVFSGGTLAGLPVGHILGSSSGKTLLGLDTVPVVGGLVFGNGN
jgi:hypothetical protein